MVFDTDSPGEVPGWDELASARSFYVSAEWLRFADTDGVARSRYLGVAQGGRLVAALSAHRAAAEIDDGYVAARALGLPPGGGEVVTLGGRRGFLSGVLAVPGGAGHLAGLLGHAVGAGDWWWPYLTSEDVDVVVAAARRPGVHLVGADCVVDVAGTSVDDHVAGLPTRQRRTNFRREEQRFRDSGLEIRRVRLADYWSRLGPLLAAVQRKYGHPQSAGEMSARLRRQGECLAGRAVVFACFRGDTVVGFSLAYRWGDVLALRVVGFDYGLLRGAGEYAQLAVHAPLRYCYEQGLRQLHLGTASYEAKCRRGARPRPLWAVTSLPGADPRCGAAGRIAAPLPVHESAPFAARAVRDWQCWTG
jgi:uncharacterized protein